MNKNTFTYELTYHKAQHLKTMHTKTSCLLKVIICYAVEQYIVLSKQSHIWRNEWKLFKLSNILIGKHVFILWCVQEEDEDLDDYDRRPYDDLADLLMNPDGDLDKLNEEGLAPLHIAGLMEKEDDRNYFTEELLAAGANIDTRATKHPSHQEGGNTALHMAVERNNITTVEILLKYSPNLNDKNDAKKTADDIADEKGHTVIKELLNDKHAEIAAKWKKGAKKARVCSIQ